MRSVRYSYLILLLCVLQLTGLQAGNLQAKREVALKGVVTDNRNQPVANVVVTDGVNFTQTDVKGHYQLLSNPDESKFVYLSIPAEYKAAVENALPTGYYSRIDATKKKEQHNFQLIKRDASADRFTYIAISDPQVKNEKQLERFRKETVNDLAETLGKCSTPDVYGMLLGDIVWDAMPLFSSYRDAISGLHATMYHVIGNHDFDLKYPALNLAENKSEYGEHAYNDNFGPTDYSFNVGKVHIIAMKDIDYKGQRKYIEEFTPAQLDWLKKDLSYVTPGSTVFLNLHAPVANVSTTDGNLRNAEELLGILKDYKVHIFAGHTHYYENRMATPDIYEHNIGAACGAWWAGGVNRCGAPNGYLVVSVDGNNISWQYKATGLSEDYQFRIYKPGEFNTQPKYLVVNVWDYDPAWKLSYYEDGVEVPGALESFADEDQAYITMKEGKATGYKTMHLFRVRPTSHAKSIKIVAVNRFGKSFEQTFSLD